MTSTSAAVANSLAVPIDTATPALLLKLDANVMHHGGLAMIRSLGRSGVPVYAVAEERSAPAAWSRYLTGRVLWRPDPAAVDDPERSPGLVAELCRVGDDLAARHGGRRPVLLCTDDAGAILVAESGDRLARHFLFAAQPADLPRRLAGKETLARLCAEVGTPSPRVRRVVDRDELVRVLTEVGLPTVVKVAEPWHPRPVALKSTTILTDPESVQELLEVLPPTIPPLLVQDHLPADGAEDWFFHGVRDADGVFRLSFTGRKLRSYPVTAGITTLGRGIPNPRLREEAERFLDGVGYTGTVDLDLRVDATGTAWLLDANPRTGAQCRMSHDVVGTDAALAQHRALTGRSLPPAPQAAGHVLIVENYDLASSVSGLLRRRLTAREWLRSFRGPREFAWWAPDDPMPCLLMWLRFLPRIVRRPRAAAAERARRRYARPEFSSGRARGFRPVNRAVVPVPDTRTAA